MKTLTRYCMFLILLIGASINTIAATDFNISVIPNKSDWTYHLGDTAELSVSITNKNESAQSFSVNYEIGLEKMEPDINKTITTNKNSFTLNVGTLKVPGFLRCRVTVKNGDKSKSKIVTLAFEPEKIKPTVTRLNDFEKYWKKQIETAKEIPLDLKCILLADRCTETYNVYRVIYQNDDFCNYSFGMLTLPKKEGKYPAVIRVPGAGVHPLSPEKELADKDIITLSLYIHPFPGDWDKAFYDSLKANYYTDYKFWGIRSRETFYYKRVITGCVKAVDVIYSLSKYDGENLAIWGASQGGALSIITAALDKRIKTLVSFCPAMCDYTGYLYGRAGGWPHYFDKENVGKFYNKKVLKTLSYYDVVNFAKMVTVPGLYSWGYNDTETPPTSFYSAYNVIKAPKEVFVIPHGVHNIYPEQKQKMLNWVVKYFKK